MKFKLFISDYDGTLGEAPKNDVDSQTLFAIDEFIKKGGSFDEKYSNYYEFVCHIITTCDIVCFD